MKIKNLKIEKATYKGYGLGFTENNPIFVPYGIPGDIVNVTETYRKKNTVFAEISEVLEASSLRKTPPCEVFGECGGCDWLHTEYTTQLNFKDMIIREIFRNIPEVQSKINQIKGSSSEFYYRNKSMLPITIENGLPTIGMFRRNSHKVIGHKHCKIQPEIYDQIAEIVQQYIIGAKVKVYNEKNGLGTLRHLGIRYSKNTNEILVILVTKSKKLPFTKLLVQQLTESFPNIVGIIQNVNPKPVNTILGDAEKILFGRSYLYEQMEEFRFKVNYRSFLQINEDQALEMYRFARNHLPEDSITIDAFSGTGTIGIFSSKKAREVICVERNEAAGADAIENGKLNLTTNCSFITEQVEIAVPKLCKEKKIDTIIFDPPRRGLDKGTIEVINSVKIPKIIYISCNPTTQVRDLELFLKAGYEVETVQPFDMFPQTYHIENIIVLNYHEK